MVLKSLGTPVLENNVTILLIDFWNKSQEASFDTPTSVILNEWKTQVLVEYFGEFLLKLQISLADKDDFYKGKLFKESKSIAMDETTPEEDAFQEAEGGFLFLKPIVSCVNNTG